MSYESSFEFAASRGFQRAPQPYESIEDSFIDQLEGTNDALYAEIFQEIASLDGQSSLAEQRRMVSQKVKNMDTKSEPAAWTPVQEQEYRDYKRVSDRVRPARFAYIAARDAYNNAKDTNMDGTTTIDEETLTRMRLRYLAKANAWFQLSMEGAQGRVSFMVKYPQAFDQKGAESHLKAARYDMSNAKDACAAIQAYVRISWHFMCLFSRIVIEVFTNGVPLISRNARNSPDCGAKAHRQVAETVLRDAETTGKDAEALQGDAETL
ncbi:hypothetical protein F4802DRAFT_599798 [Xylaria palmicola]|nr:hypothetical protein F4802DRAFT_599798 [Xylaria palmicola]